MVDKVSKRLAIDCPVEHLTNDERVQTIKWFVQLKSSTEIKQLIYDKFGKNISRVAVWRFSQRKKWKPLIKKLRTQFEKDLLKIPIANKADRLYMLQKIANSTLSDDPRAAAIALKEARAEMEGMQSETPQVTMNIINQIHNNYNGNGNPNGNAEGDHTGNRLSVA